jgi:hypothetical protein
MDTSTIIMMAGAGIMLIAVYWKAPEAAQKGLSAAGALMLEITPRMIAAFTLAALFQAIVPEDVIVRWMGHGSGLRGLLIGMSFGQRNARRTHDALSSYCFALQNGGRRGTFGRVSFGVVSFRFAAAYHVGNSISWSEGSGYSRGREFGLSIYRRLAMSARLEQTTPLNDRDA